MEPVLSDIYSK